MLIPATTGAAKAARAFNIPALIYLVSLSANIFVIICRKVALGIIIEALCSRLINSVAHVRSCNGAYLADKGLNDTAAHRSHIYSVAVASASQIGRLAVDVPNGFRTVARNCIYHILGTVVGTGNVKGNYRIARFFVGGNINTRSARDAYGACQRIGNVVFVFYRIFPVRRNDYSRYGCSAFSIFYFKAVLSDSRFLRITER